VTLFIYPEHNTGTWTQSQFSLSPARPLENDLTNHRLPPSWNHPRYRLCISVCFLITIIRIPVHSFSPIAFPIASHSASIAIQSFILPQEFCTCIQLESFIGVIDKNILDPFQSLMSSLQP